MATTKVFRQKKKKKAKCRFNILFISENIDFIRPKICHCYVNHFQNHARVGRKKKFAAFRDVSRVHAVGYFDSLFRKKPVANGSFCTSFALQVLKERVVHVFTEHRRAVT